MNKLDYMVMDFTLRLKILFIKFLYYFMFRDCKQCKAFCPTCKQFNECVKTTKRTYQLKHKKEDKTN